MEQADRVATIARALAHPARVHIVQLLAAQTECRGADVFGELPLAQSTISEHLRVLKGAGVVSARPEGNRMVYCLTAEALDELVRFIGGITAAKPACASRKAGC